MTHLAFPAYLLGILLILIPVILHLMKRKPTVPQNYPSFFFLKKTAVRKQRRNNLRKYLILLFRCLAFLCLAWAFSYPYVSSVALTPEEATVIVLDSSFSTAPSQTKMRMILDSELEKVSPAHPMLIVSAANQILWSGDFSADRPALRKWAEEHMRTQQASSFSTVLRMADSRFKSIQAKKKNIVVITDRQALPWESIQWKNKLRNTSSIRIAGETPGRKFPNIAVINAEIANAYSHAGQDFLLNAGVQNFNDGQETVSLTIELEKRTVLKKEIAIPANGTFREQFRLKNFVQTLTPIQGKVMIAAKNNVLKIDDTRYFSVNPVVPPTIFITPLPGRDPQEFIKTAMRSRKDAMDSFGINLQSLTPETAKKAPESECIIVENPKAVKEMEAVLDQQLSAGGTAVIVWQNSEETRSLLKHFGFHIRKPELPGTHRLEMVDFEHKLFKDYLEVNAGAWFDILFFNVPQLIPPQNARIVATFANSVPAIAELKYRKGKLFVLAASLNRKHTNWQTFGNFLPFWRELILYSEKPRAVQTSLTVDGSTLNMPSDGITDLETGTTVDGRKFKLDKAGNYRCGKLIYSVNVPVRESGTAPLQKDFDPSRLIDPQTAGELKNRAAEKNETLKSAAAKNSDWRLYLLLALLFLLAELGLANRTVH